MRSREVYARMLKRFCEYQNSCSKCVAEEECNMIEACPNNLKEVLEDMDGDEEHDQI